MDFETTIQTYGFWGVLLMWTIREVWPRASAFFAQTERRRRAKEDHSMAKVEELYERLLKAANRQMIQNGKVLEIIDKNTDTFQQICSLLDGIQTSMDRLESTVNKRLQEISPNAFNS